MNQKIKPDILLEIYPNTQMYGENADIFNDSKEFDQPDRILSFLTVIGKRCVKTSEILKANFYLILYLKSYVFSYSI